VCVLWSVSLCDAHKTKFTGVLSQKRKERNILTWATAVKVSWLAFCLSSTCRYDVHTTLIVSKMRRFWIPAYLPKPSHRCTRTHVLAIIQSGWESVWAAGGCDNGVDGSAESLSCGFRRSPARRLFCWLWKGFDKQGTKKNQPWRVRGWVGAWGSDSRARQRLLNLTAKGIKPHCNCDWFPSQSRWCSTGFAFVKRPPLSPALVLYQCLCVLCVLIHCPARTLTFTLTSALQMHLRDIEHHFFSRFKCTCCFSWKKL